MRLSDSLRHYVRYLGRPKAGFAALKTADPSEIALLRDLMLGLTVLFLARRLVDPYEHGAAQWLVGFWASVLLAALLYYALAFVAHWLLRLFGKAPNYREGRVALFWSILWMLPLIVLMPIFGGFFIPLYIVILLAFGYFIWHWAMGINMLMQIGPLWLCALVPLLIGVGLVLLPIFIA